MTDIPTAHRRATAVLDEVDTVIVGKRAATEVVLAGVLAGGHVLLEDFPGLGKTLAARTFAQALGLDFTRAQFTPDLLPADLTGSFVYDQRRGEFEFRKGPVFTGLLLADEINRTPPKTQAALLEAMQEHQVTVEGRPSRCPSPSTCSPPPTRSSTRAPTRCPRPSSTGSCCGSPSATRRRRRVRGARPPDGAPPGGPAGAPGHRRRRAARAAGRDGGRHRRPSVGRYCVALTRATREPRARADGRLPARLARPDARGPGVRRDPRPRLRHPRGRQGGRPAPCSSTGSSCAPSCG